MRKKICFVLGSYPVISHPFLYNQIMAVIDSNQYDVQIVVLNHTGENIHEIYRSLDDKVILFPITISKPALTRIAMGVSAFSSLILKKPSAVFNSLNFFKYKRNALNLNYLVLAKSFVSVDADIVHCHFGPTARTVSALKEIGVIKGILISSFHGADITVFPKKYGAGFYQQLFQAKGGVFTGNSQFIISKMIENGCPANMIEKIPMCLNIGQFKYRGQAPKRSLFKILTVGRLVEKKGYEYSLNAVALLKKKGISFEYNIIGEGPLMASMRELAMQLGIAEQVIFNGALKQNVVVEFYEKTDVFLLPSVTAADGDTEGQGLVLQEAQAIGVPVVATLHNGFPDSIIDGVTGYLVPERDAVALYEKLLMLCVNEPLCSKMGAEGRQFVEKNFCADVVVKKLLNLYERSIIA